MVYTRRIIDPPVEQPISLAYLKAHIRVPADLTHEEQIIQDLYIAAGVEDIEELSGRQLVTAEWEFFLDTFPCKNYFYVPLGQLQAIESFTYTGSDDTTYTWTQSGDNLLDSDSTVVAHIDFSSDPARIVLPYNGIWPSVTLKSVNPIAIRIVCGYGPFSGVVNTSGTSVTWVSGSKFSRAWRSGKEITINGTAYTMSSVTSRTALTLTSSAGALSDAPYTTRDKIPGTLLEAIALQTGHYFANREAAVVGKSVAIDSKDLARGVRDLVWKKRIVRNIFG